MLGPAALAAAYVGGYVFVAMIAVAAAIMSWEWVRLSGADAVTGLSLFLAAAVVAAFLKSAFVSTISCSEGIARRNIPQASLTHFIH